MIKANSGASVIQVQQHSCDARRAVRAGWFGEFPEDDLHATAPKLSMQSADAWFKLRIDLNRLKLRIDLNHLKLRIDLNRQCNRIM